MLSGSPDAQALADDLEREVCPQHQRRYWESADGLWCPLCEDDAPTIVEAVDAGLRVLAHGHVDWAGT